MSNKTEQKEMTIAELLQSEHFKTLVRQEFNSLCKKRNDRPKPGKGLKYKRDWYDRMKDKGMLNVQFFLDNILDIWLKASILNSEQRQVIQYVCDIAANKVLGRL